MDKPKAPAQAPPTHSASSSNLSVRLEVLEQRVLLAGDLVVANPLLPQAASGLAVTAVASSLVPAVDASANQSILPSAKVAHPPSVVSATGSEQLAADVPLTDGKLLLQVGSTLVGSGDLALSLVNQGVVAPGASPGVLSVQSFSQTASGKLQVQIGGLTAGAGSSNVLDGYDQVNASGQATLAGTLSLDFINDFRPVVGQVFDVMKWSARSGSFTSYTGLDAGKGIFLKPVYQADRLQLVATALPGLANLSIADVPEAQTARDQVLTSVANAVSQTALSFDASLELSGVRLSGSWQVSVALLGGGGVETTFVAKNVAAEWSAAGLTGALSAVSGTLVLSASQSSLSMSGLGEVVLPTGDTLSGNFSLSRDSETG